MAYKVVGKVGTGFNVCENPRNGKLIVHFMAVKGYDCNTCCPIGYDEMRWNVGKTGREYAKAFQIAKGAYASVRKVTNQHFGGGLSFYLSLEELQALDIWN